MEVQLVSTVDLKRQLTRDHEGESSAWSRLIFSPSQVQTANDVDSPPMPSGGLLNIVLR